MMKDMLDAMLEALPEDKKREFMMTMLDKAVDKFPEMSAENQQALEEQVTEMVSDGHQKMAGLQKQLAHVTNCMMKIYEHRATQQMQKLKPSEMKFDA